eukprot:2084960-Pleurochrysis_carterae.AAC.1
MQYILGRHRPNLARGRRKALATSANLAGEGDLGGVVHWVGCASVVSAAVGNVQHNRNAVPFVNFTSVQSGQFLLVAKLGQCLPT